MTANNYKKEYINKKGNKNCIFNNEFMKRILILKLPYHNR